MNVNSRIARANFTGNKSGPVASFTAYRSSNASILIDNHYFTPSDNKANVCNTPMPVAPLWSIDSSFNGHVEFNQLVNKSKFININHSDYTLVNNNDGSITVTIINTLSSNINVLLTSNATSSYVKLPKDHRYILFDNNILPNGVVYRNGYNGQIIGVNVIKSQTVTLDYFLMSLILPSGLTAQTFTIKPNIIDLTQMFGSTIADYIYTLEQGEAGAGVAFFRSIYPNDYYAYDTGTDEMVGSREGSIITLPIGVKTSITPNIGLNNIFADCGYVEVYYVTI